MSLKTPCTLLLTLALVGGCGGQTPAPKTKPPTSDSQGSTTKGTELDVSAEIGALDEEKVTKVFTKSVNELQQCLSEGAGRVEFLGGSVEFYIKVNKNGRLSHAHLERSSLGDRTTEKCMLDIMRGKSWPPPVGGEVGLARKSFDFDPPNDVRPPTPWESDRVAESIEAHSAELRACKASPGSFTVTMYIGTEGAPLSVGMSPPDEAGEASVDCLVGVLKGARYPSPGSWPAKVTFTL